MEKDSRTLCEIAKINKNNSENENGNKNGNKYDLCGYNY